MGFGHITIQPDIPINGSQPIIPIFNALNPVMVGNEPSVIPVGTELWLFVGGIGGTGDDTKFYKADNAACSNWDPQNSDNPVISGVRYNSVIKVGAIYYMFGLYAAGGHSYTTASLYYWTSPDGITWTIGNSGNPILTRSSDVASIYYSLWNATVCKVGSRWHLIIECGTQAMTNANCVAGYSYTDDLDTGFDTNRVTTGVLTRVGNAHLEYIAERNAFLLIHGKLIDWPDISGDVRWDIKASRAYLDNDLTKPETWLESQALLVSYNMKHTADPTICSMPAGKTYKLCMLFNYDQGSIYQTWLNMSMVDLFDSVESPILPNCAALAVMTSDMTAITTGTPTKVIIDRIIYDSNGDFDIANNRYVVKRPGWYNITGSNRWDAADQKSYLSSIYVNGSKKIDGFVPGSGTANINAPATITLFLGVGDYIELYAWHNKGSDATIYGCTAGGNIYYTFLSVMLIK